MKIQFDLFLSEIMGEREEALEVMSRRRDLWFVVATTEEVK
jgi:hypothetical protein